MSLPSNMFRDHRCQIQAHVSLFSLGTAWAGRRATRCEPRRKVRDCPASQGDLNVNLCEPCLKGLHRTATYECSMEAAPVCLEIFLWPGERFFDTSNNSTQAMHIPD
jgi:hypothetical protein